MDIVTYCQPSKKQSQDERQISSRCHLLQAFNGPPSRTMSSVVGLHVKSRFSVDQFSIAVRLSSDF